MIMTMNSKELFITGNQGDKAIKVLLAKGFSWVRGYNYDNPLSATATTAWSSVQWYRSMELSMKGEDKVAARKPSSWFLVLRNASAYACILGVEIHVRDIRRNRSVPGLGNQHLNGVRLLAEISQGELEGAQLGSREIVLRPGNGIVGREFSSTSGGYVDFRQV